MPSGEDLKGAYDLYAEAVRVRSFVGLAVNAYTRGQAAKSRLELLADIAASSAHRQLHAHLKERVADALRTSREGGARG